MRADHALSHTLDCKVIPIQLPSSYFSDPSWAHSKNSAAVRTSLRLASNLNPVSTRDPDPLHWQLRTLETALDPLPSSCPGCPAFPWHSLWTCWGTEEPWALVTALDFLQKYGPCPFCSQTYLRRCILLLAWKSLFKIRGNQKSPNY